MLGTCTSDVALTGVWQAWLPFVMAACIHMWAFPFNFEGTNNAPAYGHKPELEHLELPQLNMPFACSSFEGVPLSQNEVDS